MPTTSKPEPDKVETPEEETTETGVNPDQHVPAGPVEPDTDADE